MDEIQDQNQANQDLLSGLRVKLAELPILVHRCCADGQPKDFRCDCVERISRVDAYDLIREKKATFVVGDRGGTPYVYRNAIIITQTVDEAIEVAADRDAAHQAELEARAAARKEAEKQKAIAKVISAFRKKLKPEENARWTDDADIIRAFETINDDGSTIKKRLLRATNQEVAEQRDYIQEMAITSSLYAALFHGAVKYWDVLLRFEGLAEDRGKYMTDADQGKGLLVSGGYGDEKLAQVDAHREENADGQRMCDVANFRPGSGGLEMNVDGEVVEAEPTYKPGHDPIRCEEGDEEKARRLREKWLEDQYKRET